MWWAIYLFTVAENGYINYAGAGTLMLTTLFVPPGASIDLTETLSSRKYEMYADYQKRVSRFIPWFPAHGPKE